MTIYAMLQRIASVPRCELATEKERQFVEDCKSNLAFLGDDICNEDLADYLTPKQIEWIGQIHSRLFD